MRAGQGFGRWGFILGNVLIAFGAPVFVTSLLAGVSAGRSGTAVRSEDLAAIGAGALFMIAGLITTVMAGQVRQAPRIPTTPPALSPDVPETSSGPAAVEPAVERTRVTDWPSVLEPLPLTLNTLDDYYTRPGSGVALFDDEFVEPYHVPKPVPRPRNARANMSGDRFCEPTSTTGTRSTGSRRRPQGG